MSLNAVIQAWDEYLVQRTIEGVASVDIAARRLIIALVAVVMVSQDHVPVQCSTNQIILSGGLAYCEEASCMQS